MNATLPIAGSDAVRATAVTAGTGRKRHSALVRTTHWLTTLAFLALLLSGGEIVLSHPRFYWGETGRHRRIQNISITSLPPWRSQQRTDRQDAQLRGPLTGEYILCTPRLGQPRSSRFSIEHRVRSVGLEITRLYRNAAMKEEKLAIAPPVFHCKWREAGRTQFASVREGTNLKFVQRTSSATLLWWDRTTERFAIIFSKHS